MFRVRCVFVMYVALMAEAGRAAETVTSEQLAADNERIKTLEGSTSAWSGQLQGTYNGSSLDHPFAGQTPNPGHFAPPPVVTFVGTLAVRYRLDALTTFGLGTGFCTESPLQGPRNTRLQDPYADVARSFVAGALRSRVDLSGKIITNHQYYDVYGYRQGLTLIDDTVYQVDPSVTLGLSFSAFYNTFAAGDYAKSQQVESQFFLDPVAEYRLNPTYSLRAVLQSVEMHTRDLPKGKYTHPQEFHQLGLAIAATSDLYIYVYLKVFPYTSSPVTAGNTLIGSNVIFNLW